MANLSFKSFIRNKNTVTILGVLICLIILYAGYTMRIDAKTALVDVYYANQTIQPKTLITSDMVSKARIPAAFALTTEYAKSYNEIVGKYSNYNTMIAEGSLFYYDLLVEEENLPDAIFYDVNEGERVVSFPVTMESTYGNSIMPSNKIDIYVKLIDEDKKVVYGQFYEKVEILGVKDSSGNNVFENTEERRTPAYVYFSLEEAKYLLFSSLQYVQDYFGEYEIEIVLVPNTKNFDITDITGEDDQTTTPVTEEVVTEVTSEYLYDFVLNKLEQIDEQENLYNELLNEIEQLKLEKEQQKNQTEE